MGERGNNRMEVLGQRISLSKHVVEDPTLQQAM